MTKKGEKNQTDSFSPTRVKPIIPATHFLLLSRDFGKFRPEVISRLSIFGV